MSENLLKGQEVIREAAAAGLAEEPRSDEPDSDLTWSLHDYYIAYLRWLWPNSNQLGIMYATAERRGADDIERRRYYLEQAEANYKREKKNARKEEQRSAVIDAVFYVALAVVCIATAAYLLDKAYTAYTADMSTRLSNLVMAATLITVAIVITVRSIRGCRKKVIDQKVWNRINFAESNLNAARRDFEQEPHKVLMEAINEYRFHQVEEVAKHLGEEPADSASPAENTANEESPA